MPTVGAIAAVASAATGVASAVSASKAKKKQQQQLAGLSDLGGYSPEEVFGSRPELGDVEYNPLFKSDPGYSNIVSQILSGNVRNLPVASQLTGDISKSISAATRQRIEGWDPSFMTGMNSLYKTRNETLAGRLPYEDALGIASDRGRFANDLGLSGSSGPQIAKDLGLTRLGLMTETGPNLAANITNILNAVDPVSRHPVPQDYLLRPSEAVPWAIQENQFGAQFDFTKALQEAAFNSMPDPQAAGMFNLKAMHAGFNSGSSNSSGAMWGAVANGLGALSSVNWGSAFGTQPQSGGYGVGAGVGTAQYQPASYGGSAPIYSNPNNVFGGTGQAFWLGDGGYTKIPKAQAA